MEADYFQFDPPPMSRPSASVIKKNAFKDPTKVSNLNRHIKRMLKHGWKFNPVELSAAAALDQQNHTSAFTKGEFHWLKGLQASRHAEKRAPSSLPTSKRSKKVDAALAKQPFPWSPVEKFDDTLEPIDDATLGTLLDEYYGDPIIEPSGTSTVMTVDEGHASNRTLPNSSNIHKEPAQMKHSCRNDMSVRKPTKNAGVIHESTNNAGATAKSIERTAPLGNPFTSDNPIGTNGAGVNVSMSVNQPIIPKNPPSLGESHSTDKRIYNSTKDANSNAPIHEEPPPLEDTFRLEDWIHPEFIEYSPTKQAFPIKKVSESDRSYVQNLYTNGNGTEEHNKNSVYGIEDLSTTVNTRTSKANEHSETLVNRDPFNDKLQEALNFQTEYIQEIKKMNEKLNARALPPVVNYDPKTFYFHKNAFPQEGSYPLVQNGQIHYGQVDYGIISTDSLDCSAAGDKQLFTDPGFKADALALGDSLLNYSPSVARSRVQTPTSNHMTSSSPIKGKPFLIKGDKAPSTSIRVNLTPDYSDSEDENQLPQVLHSSSYTEGESTIGQYIPNVQNISSKQGESRLCPEMTFTPAHFHDDPSTVFHMAAFNSTPVAHMYDPMKTTRPTNVVTSVRTPRQQSAPIAPMYPLQPSSLQIPAKQSPAEITTPTRPEFPAWTQPSPSPPTHKRFSILKGKVLGTPTKTRLYPSVPCPQLMPRNTGPHPSAAFAYSGQYSQAFDRSTQRQAVGHGFGTTVKNKSGGHKRAVTADGSTLAGPAPKKVRRTTKNDGGVGARGM